MSRKAVFVLRTFDASGDLVRGVLEQEGGSHVCYWHAMREILPPAGSYQLLLRETHFALRDHPSELRPVGHGSGIELGHIMTAERTALHGDHMIAYLQGMHRARDADGIGSWLEVR